MTEPAGAADSRTATESGGAADLPEPSAAARVLFGQTLGRARRYAQLLATIGIEHGHLGPRESPRIWDRHLSNCAVVTDLVPVGATVVDVGSGAGLPGVPMAIRREDLEVVLLEPMMRRSAFLEQVVTDVELGSRVTVVRARAEDRTSRSSVAPADWVTARAVAPLDRLLAWCLPLLSPGGSMLALKGSSARDEVARFQASAPRALRALVSDMEVVEVGREYEMQPTYVIRVGRSAQRKRGG